MRPIRSPGFALAWAAALAAIAIALTVWIIMRVIKGVAQALMLPAFLPPRDAAWVFLSFAVAIGALTMVSVQISRLMYPVRGWFHRRVLGAWLAASLEPDKKDQAKDKKGQLKADVEKLARVYRILRSDRVDAEATKIESLGGVEVSGQALEELERPISDLDSGTGSLTFYDLPLEQLCGQLAAAADLLLDEPRKMPALTVCLVGYQGAADMLGLIEPNGKPADVQAKPDGDEGSKGIGESKPKTVMLGVAMGNMQRPDDDGRAAEEAKAAAALRASEARATLARAIQRRIDAFQIAAGGQWRRKLRRFVVGTSLVFSLSITISAMPWSGFFTALANIIYAGLAGVLAAFIAMVLRDLTAIVELRRRQS